MGAEWSVTYFIIFLQVFAGLVLLRVKTEPRFAVRILGTLFLFNAGVSAIMGLPREAAIWIASDEGVVTRAFRALDAPTGYLLLAFLAARSARPNARPLAWGLIAVGTVLALAEFPFHRQMVDTEHILRAIPLYVGLGVGAFLLAAGRPWERWVALALLARGLYWGTAGVVDVARDGLGDAPHLFVNRLGLLGLMAISVLAAARLVRHHEDTPSTGVIVPVLIIGPAAALLETLISFALPPESYFRYGSVVIVNLITLGLVRPVLVILGLAPGVLYAVVARVALTAGIATLVTLVFAPFDLGDAVPRTDAVAKYGLGLLVGLLTVAALQATPSLRIGWRAAWGGTLPPEAPDAAPAEPAAQEVALAGEAVRPQWQTIVLALRGSCLPPGVAPVGEPRLTQRALVERTGIGAPRVSTLVRELNAGAAARLDAHVPGWRALPHPREAPELIHQHRGAIPGRAGVWVYYRLTPLGEKLADALAEAEFPQRSPAG